MKSALELELGKLGKEDYNNRSLEKPICQNNITYPITRASNEQAMLDVVYYAILEANLTLQRIHTGLSETRSMLESR